MGIHTALDFICNQCYNSSVDGSRCCGECYKDLCEMCENWIELPTGVKVASDKQAEEDYSDESDREDFVERFRDGDSVLICNDCYDAVLKVCKSCQGSFCSTLQICKLCNKKSCTQCIYDGGCWRCASAPKGSFCKKLFKHFNVTNPNELLSIFGK